MENQKTRICGPFWHAPLPHATKSKRYDFVLEEPLGEGVMYNILEYQDLNRRLEVTIFESGLTFFLDP